MKFCCNDRFYIEGPDRNVKGEALMHERAQQALWGDGRVGSFIGARDAICDTQSTTHSTVSPLMHVGSI